MTETNWQKVQIDQFKTADDMYISPFYSDGKTLGTPTWIWSVVVDDALYVRAYNGQKSRWYQSAKTQKAGQIHLANQKFNVSFKPVLNTNELDEKINQAYKEKYAHSPYLPPMLESGPISATVKILPQP
ncbi:DUF2255 family protein [Staphylococcus ureilyticus]|uniref:DUF2255 family protein n=1 Tax=Staphylococcus ureilyticus TaxID=94138 RepID=UPI0009284CF2|nr:DUF2255 family protein [Staphylococcus ureilyticus]MCT1914883.1 DUF2255 family protein [Staphylococcus ureilyticus]OJT32850.1 hypothetical protein BSF33_11045 [Staphylococcus ureilyticus]RNM25161.1 DUF2255 family protein [Staphylococcus cohnii]